MLREPQYQAHLTKISRVLNCDIGSLKIEIAARIHHYPSLQYMSEKEVVGLSQKAFPLLLVTTFALEKVKKLFYVPKRLEKILYEIASRSACLNDFFDKIQVRVATSDLLSSFLLEHFIGIATLEFGPLGKNCSIDAILWATTFPIPSDNGSIKPFRMLALHYDDEELLAALSLIKRDPIFLKSYAHVSRSIQHETVQLLQNLQILSFDHERDIYHLQTPLIYPWNLNLCAIRVFLIEDYCRRIYRDLGLKIENPVSGSKMSDLILELMKSKEKSERTLWGVFNILRNFSDNIISIDYGEGQDKSKIFHMDISFPVSTKNASSLGRVLWALNGLPKIVRHMPFDWFRDVINEAVSLSRRINAIVEISEFEDTAILLTSRSVAQIVLEISEGFGMQPRVKIGDEGNLLILNSNRDMKRMGLVSQIEEDRQATSIRGLAFEVLDEVLRVRPKHTMLLEELAGRLGVKICFLTSFVKKYLGDSLDLSIPGEIAPLKDPWLEMK